MLKIGDVIQYEENLKLVCLGFKEPNFSVAIFPLFEDKILDTFKPKLAVWYDVAHLDEPYDCHWNYYNILDFPVIDHIDVDNYILKSRLVTKETEDAKILTEQGLEEILETPISIAKELHSRLKENIENERFRYVEVVSKEPCNSDVKYKYEHYCFIDNDFVLTYENGKYYKVMQLKGKTVYDRYIEALTCADFHMKEPYESNNDYFYKINDSIISYKNFYFYIWRRYYEENSNIV